jgi:hypothetical protein
MKLFNLCKDGGHESTVWAYNLIEWKRAFTIVLLRFENGSRDAYHSHAFNAVSWVLSGSLDEIHENGWVDIHFPSWWPVFTSRDTTHKVVSLGRTWVLSFRGPWAKTWREILPGKTDHTTLTHGRRVVDGGAL